MRIALHSEIRAGAIGAYVERHARIPDALVVTFARVGIRNWTIWRSGERLFHLVECDDWEAAREGLRDDSADHAWQADIGRFVELFRDSEGNAGTMPLQRVWELAEQRDS